MAAAGCDQTQAETAPTAKLKIQVLDLTIPHTLKVIGGKDPSAFASWKHHGIFSAFDPDVMPTWRIFILCSYPATKKASREVFLA
jgi:hypothetical protein